MSTLLLRLAAPMQAWGVDSKFDTRSTGREPSKSGVLGLLAAALGIRRDDSAALGRLAGLKFGVRVDREGQYLHDFHMAHSASTSYVTHRYYLSDAVFLCGLESEDRELLEQYAYALTHPAYPLFLGRRSCPPTLPLVWGIRDKELMTALTEEPRLVSEPEEDSLRIVIDEDKDSRSAALIKDVPVSFSPYRREYTYRKYREIILPGTPQTEHDPFALLEVDNGSDEDGT